MAIGKVREWKMSEEERLEYIKKHPINPVMKDGKRKRQPNYAWDTGDKRNKGADATKAMWERKKASAGN